MSTQYILGLLVGYLMGGYTAYRYVWKHYVPDGPIRHVPTLGEYRRPAQDQIVYEHIHDVSVEVREDFCVEDGDLHRK
jgi:hypothetical protein